MNLTEQVLALLRGEGETLSGEEMAARLGVSRSAVWKAVGSLRAAGYRIEAGTNRGYRLLAEGPGLDAEGVRARLEGPARELRVELRDRVGSTNDELKVLAEKGEPGGRVLIAREQTRGKGRRGRSFSSPGGSGLYLSVLLRPSFSAEEALSITTAAAVAAAEAIQALSGREARIKWVNDVYLDGRKVCGVLTEASMDFESGGLSYAVLGVGVNLTPPPGGFPPELREIAGALFPENAPSGAGADLAAGFLNRFALLYNALPDRGFLAAYRERSLLTGMDVTLVRGGETLRGRVLDVDDEARLVVRLEDGAQAAFSSGETVVDKDFLKQLRRT